MPIFNSNDIQEFEKLYRTNLINKLSGLRSAHLIATQDNDGTANVAIFNTVIHIGANPPLIGFILRPTTVERHTYQNIKETGLYTINAVHKSFHAAAHQTSAKYTRDISEFEACGLDSEYFDDFNCPFVKDSQLKIGLRLVEEKLLESNGTRLIVGEIEKVIIPDAVLSVEGDIHHESLQLVMVSGLDTYYSISKIESYPFARPDVE